MPSHQEYSSAFNHLADSLRESVQVIVQALQAHRGTPGGDVLEQHLEKTLERLANLLGLGTYENLSVSEIFASAIHGESLIAQEYRREIQSVPQSQTERRAQLSEAAERHKQRAHALINAARRGNRLAVPEGPFSINPYRGIFVRPFPAKVHAVLVREQEHFVRWREGAVAAVPETLMPELAQAGAELTVLYLDADELFDQAGKQTKESLEQEFERRLAVAVSNGNRGIADPLQRHINRLLLHQNVVLHNLQQRLEDDHAVAHRAVQPILDETHRLLETGLLAHATWTSPADDPFGQVIDLESKAQEHAALWLSQAQEDAGAGWRPKLQYFVDAGTLLDELKRAHEEAGPNT